MNKAPGAGGVQGPSLDLSLSSLPSSVHFVTGVHALDFAALKIAPVVEYINIFV